METRLIDEMAPARQLDVDVAVQRGTFRLEVATTVAPGEVLGVLGPNGAGKTTLLRALAGLVAVTEGSIRLGDTVLDDAAAGTFVPAERRPVGLVFQNYRLFPHLNVRDNVAFAARSGGAPRGKARRHAERYLSQLDLTALAGRKPAQRPAARPNASLWPGLWRPTRRCCCSTSRCPRSMPAPASRCAPSYAVTSKTSAGPSCSSPTTRSKRWS
jgi:ABC-type spermidine/putrescine transport systems, ATPase components